MSKAFVSALSEDERPRVYLRAVIALVSACSAFEYFAILKRVLASGIVPLPFLDFLPRLPLTWLPAFITCWLLLALLFIKRREFGFLLVPFIFYALLMDERSYSNHSYLLGLVVFLLAAGWERLLPFQISAVYLFSALAKLNLEYMSGDVLSAFIAAPRLPAPLYSLIATASIVTEIFVAVALWLPALRRLGFFTAAFIHIGMILLLVPLTLLGKFQLVEFATLMLSCYYYVLATPRHNQQNNHHLSDTAIRV